MSGDAMIVVTVEDVNDHAPVFSQSSYTSTFPENVFGGYTVGDSFYYLIDTLGC